MAQHITVAGRWQKKTIQLHLVIKGRERPGAGILTVSSRTPLPPKTYSSQLHFLKVSPSSFKGCGPSFSMWAFGKIFQSQTITAALGYCLRIFTSNMAKRVKVFASKTDDLSSSLRTHMVQGEK